MDYTQSIPSGETVRDAVTRAPKKRSNILLLSVLVLSSALIWLVVRGEYYSPGDDFGYYLGVVGASMMLALLLYPLRKHVSFLSKLGAMSHWFRFHMLLGIGGPTLILLHSKFTIGSLNAW
jgi:hypothetical protein